MAISKERKKEERKEENINCTNITVLYKSSGKWFHTRVKFI